MAGRYKEMMDNVDDRPYWQYVAVMDSRTRPAHAALNGKVFRYDDPFWDTHYPPLGFRCRCRVRALSEKNIKDRRNIVSDSTGKLTEKDVLVSKKTGELATVTVYDDPFTGEKISPDVGWNYNPGKEWMQPFTPRPLDPKEFEGGYKTVGAAFHKKTPVEKLPAKALTKDMLLSPHQESGITEKGYINGFLKEFGAEMGKPVVFRDKINDPVIISEELFKDRSSGGYKVLKGDREIYLPMLADTIKDPVEIWLTWVHGKDKTRLCKRYIGVYKDAKGKVGGYAVFDLIDDAWRGTTAFKPENMKYLDSMREGVLLYVRE